MVHSFFSQVTVAPDVLFRFLGGEAVLLNLRTEMYLGLDTVGTQMWNQLTQAACIQDAYDALLNQYEVEPSRLREDLHEFIDKLLAQGLIEVGTR